MADIIFDRLRAIDQEPHAKEQDKGRLVGRMQRARGNCQIGKVYGSQRRTICYGPSQHTHTHRRRGFEVICMSLLYMWLANLTMGIGCCELHGDAPERTTFLECTQTSVQSVQKSCSYLWWITKERRLSYSAVVPCRNILIHNVEPTDEAPDGDLGELFRLYYFWPMATKTTNSRVRKGKVNNKLRPE